MPRHPNTLFVVAAGNAGSNNDEFASSPCTEDNANLICVAATTPSDGLATFSNFGATTVGPRGSGRSSSPASSTSSPAPT